MNTKEQIEQCIKSLEWLKFNIVGTEDPKKNTFEYATKVYLENAIALLKDQESDEVLDIIIKKRLNLHLFLNVCNGENGLFNYNRVYGNNRHLTETEFNKIKERLVK